MTLRQAIGVIIGANVGTTATAFIIGIKISEYALPIIALGTLLIFFFKNPRINNYGQTIFGFGSLFLGLNLMSDGLRPLRDVQAFADLTVSMSENPLLGVLIGVIFTVAVQSSTAAIGLLQTLFGQGLMDLNAALPVLFGDNIGTTITAVLAAIGASIAARRAALAQVIFNLVGTTIVLILLRPFTILVEYVRDSLNLSPEMTIAFAHGIFNVSNAIIQLPFVAVLAWIVIKVIPGKDSAIPYKTVHLDEQFIRQSPAIALGQGKKEVIRMAELSEQGLKEANLYFKTKGKKHGELIPQYEDAINNLDKKITEYLMELVEYQITNKVKFSDSAISDLDEMFELTLSTLRQSINALETESVKDAHEVLKKEEQIDKMERNLRKKHIIRLNENKCTGDAGIIYVDIISNLERIGDHAVNIAEEVIGE
ncbi:phosphate:Na+ symporter [Evansella vedderi]|uniref:Phosphate:Na+ symporter n=1 Tax=Evansella vedderi TaxID=38282 RepID=A0ABT9ZS98_9BACI|nr:phosphate:Na+ symporter [Evansella vedderi]